MRLKDLQLCILENKVPERRNVVSAVKRLVCLDTVQEDAGLNPISGNVVLPVFPLVVTCPPSSNQNAETTI